MLARRLTGSLLLHGVLVPETYQVSVGIGEFGPVTPVGLARAMDELDSPCGPVCERGIDVGNLKPQSALVGPCGRSTLLQEDREAVGVLDRGSLPVRTRELQHTYGCTIFLQEVRSPVVPNQCALWFQVANVDTTF